MTIKVTNKLCGILLLLAVSIISYAQIDPHAPLPLDESVRYGVLENGMTYYIKSNQEPKERASFYIIQNVGALLEEDHQDGLAHFLEHMAFNGTKHFPEKGIIDFLERHGVAFGEDINAYTSFNETVYNLSDVPLNKAGVTDTSLLILHDWSNYLLLTEEEIDAERGVISEEYRTRRNAGYRMLISSLPYMLPNSKYAERTIIGDLEVIQNFEYDALRDFYHDWYRTDLQAIAIAGDFNADEMEEKVKALFSGIPAVENPKERPFFEVPDQEEQVFHVVTDKEASTTTISLDIRMRKPESGPSSLMDLRDDYVESLFNSMMAVRIEEMLQKGNPPFIAGGIDIYDSFARGYQSFSVSVIPKPNEEALGLEAILTELERVKRFGFSQGELNRARADRLAWWEKFYKQKDKISNESYIRQFQAHFLEEESYLSADMEYELVKALLPTITLEDFSSRLEHWVSGPNRVLLIRGPEGEGYEHLAEAESLAILEAAAMADVEPYLDQELAESLVNIDLNPVELVAEKELEIFDAVEWTLENGVKVVFKHADFEKDQVQIRAYSRGGSSIYPDEYVPAALMFTNLLGFYGAGEFDAMELQKMLSGKNISVDLSLGSSSEGLSGTASPQDMEAMMQLIYLYFEDPQVDREAHDAVITRFKALLQNMNNNPQKIMGDSLQLIGTDYHPRTRIMDVAFLGEVEYDKIMELYRDRWADASDFVFIIVGNMEAEEVQLLARTYLGAITDLDREETWVDRKVNEPEGRVEKVITLPLETPKANVNIMFHQEMEYNPHNRMVMSVLQNILDLRFTESIREEEGGTYGVSAWTGLERIPVEKAFLQIRFDCDPEKAGDLKNKVYAELDKLASDGPNQNDLDKTVENILKNREESKEHNSFFLGNLNTWYVQGINFADPANYEDIVKSLTVKDVKKIMKAFYKKANVVDVVFMPEPVEEPAEE